ncbi:transcriptional regulator [Bacillus spongiae]|uniref:LexA family protein n=1 Tax=Bacillus spongiae TaxID=2683610 RepID=UPI003AF6987C
MYYFSNDHESLAEKMRKRENEVLAIISEYISKNKKSPSIKEILHKSSLKSSSTVHAYLQRLKENGSIDYTPKSPRSIIVKK